MGGREEREREREGGEREERNWWAQGAPEVTRSRETTQCRKIEAAQEHTDADRDRALEAKEAGSGELARVSADSQATPPGTSWPKSPSVRLTHSP